MRLIEESGRVASIFIISGYGIKKIDDSRLINLRRILKFHFFRYKAYGLPGNVMQIVPKSKADGKKIINVLEKVIIKGEHFNMFRRRHGEFLRDKGKTFVLDRYGPIYLVAKDDRAFKVDDDFMKKSGYAR